MQYFVLYHRLPTPILRAPSAGSLAPGSQSPYCELLYEGAEGTLQHALDHSQCRAETLSPTAWKQLLESTWLQVLLPKSSIG